jgi:hypothetical protein
MKSNFYRIQLIFSIIMIALVIIILSVITFGFKKLDMKSYAFVNIAILIWPITIVLYKKQFLNIIITNQEGRAPVKLSLIGWFLLCSVILLYNYIVDRKVSWAYYPIAGITLWPIGMLLYNYLCKKINSD